MSAVTLKNLSKSYDGKTPVLSHTDLEVASGEMFFLLGPSGCGKTTLLRIIAGFLNPDSGQVLFGNRDVSALPPEKRDIGMVFQNYALWPHLDVAHNITFGLEMRKVSQTERTRHLDEMLELVDLKGFGGRNIASLSGGQQQRVALARALIVKPKLLLLDEPLSNLDARLRTTMRAEIRRVCKAAGVTAIYVTHDQSEALSTADRIALLSGGRVSQVGSPRELYDRPQNRGVAEFVGEANLLPGKLVAPGEVTCALGTLITRAVAPGVSEGDEVMVCVRPERFHPAALGGPNLFSARVTAATFLGVTGQWQLDAGGQSLLMAEGAPSPRSVGDSLSLSVDPEHVIVFKP